MAMAVHGLDRAAAPGADVARKMLDDIGGTWWNVYIGGPGSSASGWTPDTVRAYREHGVGHFLLIYAGRQQNDVPLLTESQGEHDGRDACTRAALFGYSGTGVPLCLDLEGKTFDAAPARSLDYASGWCHAVRAAGLRPGVYSNPRALVPLAQRAVRPDWVWVASWVTHQSDHGLDPHKATGMPDDLWSKTGPRAWQYAGEFDDHTCRVRGLDVDINVADGAVLVPAAIKGAAQFTKSVVQLATEVLAGKWGNGPERVKRLTAAGHDAKAVQAEVNKLLQSVAQVAAEVLAGKWGNGPDRIKRLTAAGFDPIVVQAEVNRLLLQ
jgi:hypothetical protein